MTNQKIKIEFLPFGTESYAQDGETLLAIALRNSIDIEASCGSQGTCGKCLVQIISGNDENLDKHELSYLSKAQVQNGFRLACRVIPKSNMIVSIQGTNTAKFRKTQMGILPPDFLQWLNQKREKNQLMTNDKNIQLDNDNRNNEYGIAFDIGTTTVVGFLWNLSSYELVAVSSKTNPQGNVGGDVISRINYANQSQDNLLELKEKIGICLNDIVQEFVDSNQLKLNKLSNVVIVGNTTMSHLLLGVSPRGLAIAPFRPEFLIKEKFAPTEIMLNAPNDCVVTLLPNIAGHIGSDIVGVLIASRLMNQKGTNIAIDIGTNGEIVLSDDGKTYACSTAAGPAFEGVSIRKGMRASAGAIEGVKIIDGEVKLTVIDDGKPIGICGSGLIDAISEMLINNIIDYRGKLLNKEDAIKLGLAETLVNRLINSNNGKEFILAFSENDESDHITISQKDIREVQLAKGAIYSGIKILLIQCGKTIEDIDKIYMAGAFGNYINKDSAVRIGLLPNIAEKDIVSIGNAACTGAYMALLSSIEMDLAFKIPSMIEHVELAVYPNFQDEYINSMNFPKTI